jgi:hypothetical protein
MKMKQKMPEAWDIKTDDKRKINTKKVFIIYCEDGEVEPAYFETFKHDQIQLTVKGNKKQHQFQINLIAEEFRQKGLLKYNPETKKETLDIEEGAQVWAVFDRDKEEGDFKDTAFNDSITAAADKGIKTAWSNDDFELWILLHFEDVDSTNPAYHHRQKYYERLTDILKKLYPDIKPFNHEKYNYKDSMKTKKNFLSFTYQTLKNSRSKAIDRAQKLEKLHELEGPKPPHELCPCTKVHHLVLELLKTE